jgi:opacity protein-like surface antigen
MEVKTPTFSNDFDADGITNAGAVRDASGASNDLAAELMAGLSFRLDKALFLDVGYKLTYLGSAETDYDYVLDIPYGTGNVMGNGQLKADNLITHDIRVGLRYDIY